MSTRVEHWSLRSRPLAQLLPPEEDGICLFGLVVGHPRHSDGKEVLTSPVTQRRADRLVTRSGSEYELGPVDPAYERCYPEARQRLLARLGESAPQR